MVRKETQITVRSSAAEYLTYVASVGDREDSFEMRYEDENIWLTQKMMATLYNVDVRTINDHIKKIYSDSELEEAATIRKFRIVQTEGSRQVERETNHYNLQMIIAVGFKVNNERAVQFRKWANGIVKDYTIKGWVIDAERLKNGGSVLTTEYFDRLLEQILRFYRDVLGFEIKEAEDTSNVYLVKDGTLFLLYGRKDFEKMTSTRYEYVKGLNGHSEIALYVDTFEEVDMAYKNAIEHGATSVLEPELEPWGQRTCYIADPEGNLIEIGSWNKPYEEKDL